jgi:3-phosphoshikimate 1-carboxyvinyltransferase
MIDEYPVLAVAAAFAEGTTVMRGLGELRVKESDRLAAMADGLAACGAKATVEGDDLIVDGGPRPAGGVEIDARLDHRIAMSFLVLGGLARAPVTVRGAEAIETSFPGFAALMNTLGADIAPVMAPA